MAKILEMPKLSPTMEEGVLAAWHKKEGDAIAVDDLLAEVETDKATMEFRAFDKTTLAQDPRHAGSQVKLGQPVAIVGEPGEDISALLGQAGATAQAPAPPSPPARDTKGPPPAEDAKAPAPAGESATPPASPAPSASPAQVAPTTPPPETAAPVAQRKPPVVNVLERASFPGESSSGGSGEGADGGRVLASPYVRKVAREKGIDLKGAHGSGPRGRFVPADLDAMTTQGSESLARAPTLRDASTLAAPEVRPLSPMRTTIARRLMESKATVPHFYLTIDVDVAELVKLRTADQRRDVLEGRRGRRRSGRPRRCRSTISSSRRARWRSCACPSATRASRRMRSWSTSASTSRSPWPFPTDS